jgi:hypothetical protein
MQVKQTITKNIKILFYSSKKAGLVKRAERIMCQQLSLIYKEEHRLGVSEKRVLGRTFEPQRQQVRAWC